MQYNYDKFILDVTGSGTIFEGLMDAPASCDTISPMLSVQMENNMSVNHSIKTGKTSALRSPTTMYLDDHCQAGWAVVLLSQTRWLLCQLTIRCHSSHLAVLQELVCKFIRKQEARAEPEMCTHDHG